MKIKVKSAGDCETSVENDGENITIWQEDEEEIGVKDMVMLFDAKMARKFIKAIRKNGKELGWEV